VGQQHERWVAVLGNHHRFSLGRALDLAKALIELSGGNGNHIQLP